MGRITETLVRKRSEHNELEISTLEELSLHQQDIEKIEYLDKWCRNLKILYLQSNLIDRIENVSRLKKLEYLNLALNNIELIENLEGCESLQKLDLTVNFVGELTSIESLRGLEFLGELYLTGNPCTEYEGYKDFVIATLPKLKKLDGIEIEKSERIEAMQNLHPIRGDIIHQQRIYAKNREREKQREMAESGGRWYTDTDSVKQAVGSGDSKYPTDAENDEFWSKPTAYTPETRKATHEHMRRVKERDEKKEKVEEKAPRKFFTDDGRAMNVNEAKVDFTFDDDEVNNQYILDVAAFKHMDTSLMDADVHPYYVRVILKGKVFQLCLDEEVNTDKSTAQRSTTTGHLIITMPKAKPAITKSSIKPEPAQKPQKQCSGGVERLEVDPSKRSMPDIGNIIKERSVVPPLGIQTAKQPVKPRENSPDFVDDPDVPPLI